MKMKCIPALCAAALVSLPSMAGDEPDFLEPRYGNEVDAELSFNFTILRVGSIREGNDLLIIRANRERFDQRDLMNFAADAEGIDLPRGARIMMLNADVGIDDEEGGPESGVYITDRFGDPLLDISDYFIFEYSPEAVVVGNYRDREALNSENSQTVFAGNLRIVIPFFTVEPLDEGAETIEVDDFIQVCGNGTNRYTNSETERRNTLRKRTSTRTDFSGLEGSGEVEGREATVTGRVRTFGREDYTIELFKSIQD